MSVINKKLSNQLTENPVFNNSEQQIIDIVSDFVNASEDAPNIDPLPHFNFEPVAHRNFDPLPHIYLDPVAHRNFDPYFPE